MQEYKRDRGKFTFYTDILLKDIKRCKASTSGLECFMHSFSACFPQAATCRREPPLDELRVRQGLVHQERQWQQHLRGLQTQLLLRVQPERGQSDLRMHGYRPLHHLFLLRRGQKGMLRGYRMPRSGSHKSDLQSQIDV